MREMHRDRHGSENADAKPLGPVLAEKIINHQGPEIMKWPQNQGMQHPED
jgi:hypothetical protein